MGSRGIERERQKESREDIVSNRERGRGRRWKRKTGRQTGHDREMQGRDKKGRAEKEWLEMKRTRERIYYRIHCMQYFLYTITAQHCRGINTVWFPKRVRGCVIKLMRKRQLRQLNVVWWSKVRFFLKAHNQHVKFLRGCHLKKQKKKIEVLLNIFIYEISIKVAKREWRKTDSLSNIVSLVHTLSRQVYTKSQA